jgi:hypothetical protein
VGYPYLVDAGRFAEASALFVNGKVRLEFEKDSKIDQVIFDGTDGVRRWMDKTPLFPDGTPRTRHICTNVLIEIDGDIAKSRCYVNVMQQTPDLPLQSIAVGIYADAFERFEGDWRFTDRLVTGFMAGNVSAHRAKD